MDFNQYINYKKSKTRNFFKQKLLDYMDKYMLVITDDEYCSRPYYVFRDDKIMTQGLFTIKDYKEVTEHLEDLEVLIMETQYEFRTTWKRGLRNTILQIVNGVCRFLADKMYEDYFKYEYDKKNY